MSNYTTKSLEGKLILAATILASGMAFLDGTVVNIAVPEVQTSFNATLGNMQWIINSYALILASLILISGSFGDRFGRRRIFIYGIGLFIIASLLCSLSQTIDQLIVFRTIQGIGAAMMIPGSLSIINTSFDKKEQGKAIGLWSGFAGGVAALGPFLGGWLVQTFGWPSIFYINIPIGLMALFLTIKYVPESKNIDAKKLDLIGTFLLLTGLLGISYALIEAPTRGLTEGWVVGSFLIGMVSFIIFYAIEKKIKEPLVPLHIFKSPLVLGANLVTLFLYFALNGIIFFLILNLQQLQHYSPIAAGLSMLPTILLITFLSGPAGSLSDRIGPRKPMIIGPLLVSLGIVWLFFMGTNTNYFTDVLPGLLLFGLGMSLVIAPLTKSSLAVDTKYSGAASGVNNAVSRVASLLAIALLGAVMVTTFSAELKENITHTNLTTSQKQQIIEQKDKLGGIQIPTAFDTSSQHIAKETIDNAFLYAFKIVMGISAALALLGAVISFTMIHNKEK
ncbi:MAG: MFS transporter [Candidatus Levybacteria bacterium]|nr:MFS transporter [Candidatus Levybacteria bacterium]